MGNYPWRRMNHKLINGMKICKGNGNTTTLLFSLKGLEMLHQKRRVQVKTIAMEHFNSILFHKYGPANKQHTNQSINQSINQYSMRQAVSYTRVQFLKLLCTQDNSALKNKNEDWILRSSSPNPCITLCANCTAYGTGRMLGPLLLPAPWQRNPT